MTHAPIHGLLEDRLKMGRQLFDPAPDNEDEPDLPLGGDEILEIGKQRFRCCAWARKLVAEHVEFIEQQDQPAVFEAAERQREEVIAEVAAVLVEARGIGLVERQTSGDRLGQVREDFPQAEPLLALQVEVDGRPTALIPEPLCRPVKDGGLANTPLAVQNDDVLLFRVEHVANKVEEVLTPVEGRRIRERDANHVGIAAGHYSVLPGERVFRAAVHMRWPTGRQRAGHGL